MIKFNKLTAVCSGILGVGVLGYFCGRCSKPRKYVSNEDYLKEVGMTREACVDLLRFKYPDNMLSEMSDLRIIMEVKEYCNMLGVKDIPEWGKMRSSCRSYTSLGGSSGLSDAGLGDIFTASPGTGSIFNSDSFSTDDELDMENNTSMDFFEDKSLEDDSLEDDFPGDGSLKSNAWDSPLEDEYDEENRLSREQMLEFLSEVLPGMTSDEFEKLDDVALGKLIGIYKDRVDGVDDIK